MWLDIYEKVEKDLEKEYKVPKALNAAILSFYIEEIANYWEGTTTLSAGQKDYVIEQIQKRLNRQ